MWPPDARAGTISSSVAFQGSVLTKFFLQRIEWLAGAWVAVQDSRAGYRRVAGNGGGIALALRSLPWASPRWEVVTSAGLPSLSSANLRDNLLDNLNPTHTRFRQRLARKPPSDHCHLLLARKPSSLIPLPQRIW